MASGDPGDTGGVAEELGRAPTPAAPGTVASQIGERPEADKLVRAVARARISDALFASKQQVKVGRYHLLEMVGAGGMGVVWGAWDPELERRVAIKLLRATIQSARDRILLEGQALAKLSHPNVVPVYDVGVVDDQVYIVMEWVRGDNLRAYCREPRTVRELLAVYRAAGDGLSAAHRAGLVHRDFKPDNAILGDDGRVRILDFGLARGEVRPSDGGDSPLTRGAGTPRYMPPEQAHGEELTPAVDQYAFCVSLREALIGRNGPGKDADLPSWLAELLARGTAEQPAQRHPSMDALLRALANDPARVWRRRLVVAGAVAAAGAAFAVGTLRASPTEIDRCAGAGDDIAASWNPGVRGALAAHLGTLGPYGVAEAARLGAAFDRHGQRWASARREACLAREHDDLALDLYERKLGCLVRTRVALETIVEVLARVERERLPDAVAAVSGLPDAAECLGETGGSTVEPPPVSSAAEVALLDQDIQRADVLGRAVTANALGFAEATVAKAERLGYLPFIARAHFVHGFALTQRQRHGEAAAALDRATDRAFEAGDPRTAIIAYAQEIHEISRETDRSKLPAGAAQRAAAVPILVAIARGLQDSGSYERAYLYNSIGTVRLTAGDRAAARAAFQDALREQARTTRQRDLGWIWGNLALVTDDPAERDRLLGRSSIELERSHGPDHPLALSARLKAAQFVDHPEHARAQLADLCRRFATLHPHLPDRTRRCRYELGVLAEERGDAAAARGALAALTDTSHEAIIAAGYLLALDGRHAEVIARMAAAAATLIAGDHVWDRLHAVDALALVAASQRALRRDGDAVATLRRALALGDGLATVKTSALHRRLARLRAALARLLIAREPAAARELAGRALAWYRAAGGYDAVVAELTAMASR